MAAASAPVQKSGQRQHPRPPQQKARRLQYPSLPRHHRQTWTLFKDLPLMDASPSPEQRSTYNNKVTAVVQVHVSLRNKMAPQGPLGTTADLIYMTNIAASNVTSPSTTSLDKNVNELIFLLPHRPETIRFWIDERPVGHPDVSKEKIRKGLLDDSRNCSVIKVCLAGSDKARGDASTPKESDIYLPPAPHSARVWIYLDPKVTRGTAGQEKAGFQDKNSMQPKEPEGKSPAEPTRRRSSFRKSRKPPQKSSSASTQKPPQEQRQDGLHCQTGSTPKYKLQVSPKESHKMLQGNQAPPSYSVPIPSRRSSKKVAQRSPLSIYPPTNAVPSPVEETSNKEDLPIKDYEAPSSTGKEAATSCQPNQAKIHNPFNTTSRRPTVKPASPSETQACADTDYDSEPEGFKNDIFNDISRLMTNSDPFGRFHSSFPEKMAYGGDSEDEGVEERDYFPTCKSPLDGMPTLSQAQRDKFYKAGKRAQSSIFFDDEEEAALPGGNYSKIVISHVEKPPEMEKRDFVKPSRASRLRRKFTGVWPHKRMADRR